MGMPAVEFWTAEMVRALPEDGKRYETVHGELLVTPAPRPWHQEIVGRLHYVLRRYLDAQPVGRVLTSPADISWSQDSLVQPDVFVVCLEEARAWDWSLMRNLLLVAEVLSPTTLRQDRFTKRRIYQENGVGAYWLVDPDQEAVEVWTPDATFPVLERKTLHWNPVGSTEPFDLTLEELFGPI
jgi:Uma2 family endonuclease